jgi:dipeptidyl-peptidase-4
VTINDKQGKQLRSIEDNQPLVSRMSGFNLAKKEFFKVKINNNDLNGWMLKPIEFDSTKKHPLFMFVYGGDGKQEVMDEYDSFDAFWFSI